MRGALSPDGTRAVGYDQHGSGEIALWNVESGQLMGRLKPPRRSISGADGPGLRMVRFTKDGQGLRALQRDGATLHFAADALMKRCQQRRRASLYITASRASTPRSSGVATGRPGRGAQSLITRGCTTFSRSGSRTAEICIGSPATPLLSLRFITSRSLPVPLRRSRTAFVLASG
jgi:hypothetical protein